MCRLVRAPGLVEEGGRVYTSYDQSPLQKRIKLTEQSFPSSHCSHFLFGSTKIQLRDLPMDNSDGAVGYIIEMFQKYLQNSFTISKIVPNSFTVPQPNPWN